MLENLSIENCRNGISQEGGDNCKITKNTVKNCPDRGIFLGISHSGEVSYNNLYQCGTTPMPASGGDIGCSIALYQGDSNHVVGNYIEGGGANRQIDANGSLHVEIIQNRCVNAINLGIAPQASYAHIAGNTVTNSGQNAIDTMGSGSDYNIIENNIVSRVWGAPIPNQPNESTGICLNTRNTICRNNTIEVAGYWGIHLVDGNNNNQIIGNNIRNSGWESGVWAGSGILLQILTAGASIDGTVIDGNIIYDNQTTKTQNYGIYLYAGSGYITNTVIQNNDLRNNGVAGINAYDQTRVPNLTLQNNQY
jgi:parallel beta-helix repeat protein